MTDLHYLSASELLRAFRAKEISPLEAYDAVSARADAVEPVVNCLLERDHEDYRAQASAATERYAKGSPVGPLDGVPVALKEEQPIAGRPLRSGSLLTEGYVAPQTHPVVQRILDAGGIAHARTTTPEFSAAAFTHTELWGVTRNPWNPDYTVGGSSGGAGAALASGTAYLASGSDIGGSIRIPSSFCGVVGFKGPYGRVPTTPPFTLDTYCHEGAMARTVADVALFHNVIQGQHLSDHASLPALLIPQELGDVAGLRVALAVTLGDYPVEPGIEANTRAFGAALAAAGAVVDEVAVDVSRELVERALFIHFGGLFGPSMLEFGAEIDDARFMPYTRLMLQRSTEAYRAYGTYCGLVIEAAVQASVARVFEDHDVLLAPTLGVYGFLAGQDHLDGVDVAGNHYDSYAAGLLTPVFNIASRHPVLNVPSGVAPQGVPTGVQIVARPYDDVTAFHVGAAAERELGLWNDPGWRPAI